MPKPSMLQMWTETRHIAMWSTYQSTEKSNSTRKAGTAAHSRDASKKTTKAYSSSQKRHIRSDYGEKNESKTREREAGPYGSAQTKQKPYFLTEPPLFLGEKWLDGNQKFC
ncbi:hypothetical protein COOONC_26790 [Cooperia oncophora]